MNDRIQYNGFIGSVHFCSEDEIFYGKIEGIPDLVNFEGESVSQLKESFQDAVQDYIELCTNLNKDPYKSFKGTFNVRISPELHKKAFQTATVEGISLNAFVQNAISKEIALKQNLLQNP